MLSLSLSLYSWFVHCLGFTLCAMSFARCRMFQSCLRMQALPGSRRRTFRSIQAGPESVHLHRFIVWGWSLFKRVPQQQDYHPPFINGHGIETYLLPRNVRRATEWSAACPERNHPPRTCFISSLAQTESRDYHLDSRCR